MQSVISENTMSLWDADVFGLISTTFVENRVAG